MVPNRVGTPRLWRLSTSCWTAGVSPSFKALIQQEHHAGNAHGQARILKNALGKDCDHHGEGKRMLHFRQQRPKPDAQFEIRRYAQGVFNILKSELANLGIGASDFASN